MLKNPNAEAILHLHNGLSTAVNRNNGSRNCPFFNIVEPVFRLAFAPTSNFNGALPDGLEQTVVHCNVSKPQYLSLFNSGEKFMVAQKMFSPFPHKLISFRNIYIDIKKRILKDLFTDEEVK